MHDQVALFERPDEADATLATFWACVYGLARVTGSTPRDVLDFAFRRAPDDERWHTLVSPFIDMARADDADA